MIMKSQLLIQITLSIIFFNLIPLFIQAQTVKQLTFEEAFEIAEQNSPDIQRARLSLDRSRELLNAQEASLKSRFSFTVEPFFFSHQREFNTFFSTWNTSELKSSSGTFTIAQPILLTDGTLALQNQLSKSYHLPIIVYHQDSVWHELLLRPDFIKEPRLNNFPTVV